MISQINAKCSNFSSKKIELKCNCFERIKRKLNCNIHKKKIPYIFKLTICGCEFAAWLYRKFIKLRLISIGIWYLWIATKVIVHSEEALKWKQFFAKCGGVDKISLSLKTCSLTFLFFFNKTSSPFYFKRVAFHHVDLFLQSKSSKCKSKCAMI